jgi:hypothetical protein
VQADLENRHLDSLDLALPGLDSLRSQHLPLDSHHNRRRRLVNLQNQPQHLVSLPSLLLALASPPSGRQVLARMHPRIRSPQLQHRVVLASLHRHLANRHSQPQPSDNHHNLPRRLDSQINQHLLSASRLSLLPLDNRVSQRRLLDNLDNHQAPSVSQLLVKQHPVRALNRQDLAQPHHRSDSRLPPYLALDQARPQHSARQLPRQTPSAHDPKLNNPKTKTWTPQHPSPHAHSPEHTPSAAQSPL